MRLASIRIKNCIPALDGPERTQNGVAGGFEPISAHPLNLTDPDRNASKFGGKGIDLDALHAFGAHGVKRLSILTPDRRAKLTPLSGTAEVVPVVNRGGTC